MADPSVGQRILGAAMIVIGAIFWFAGGPYLMAAGVSLMIGGALSIASSLIAPRASGSDGIDSGTTYGSNIRSIAAEGAPKKIVLGAMRMQPEIASIKTVNTGDSETVFMLLHVCAGGDYGIESISEIEINNTSTDHFSGTETQTRLGTSSQTVMNGFDVTSIAYPVNEEVGDTAWEYTTKGSVDEITVVLAWLGGFCRISKSGIKSTQWAASFEYQNDGETEWNYVHAPSQVEDGWGTYNNGGLGWVATGASTSVARRAMHIEFSSKKKRKIRINAYRSWSDENYRRTATVVRIEEGVDDSNAYAGEALLGIKYIVSGQLSGGIPKVTALVKGWKVKNFGDATAAWTQNPAKAWLAVLTDEANGAGRFTPLSMFDDGSGGTWRSARDSYNEQVTVKTDTGKTRSEDRVHLDLILDTMESVADWNQHFEKLTRSTIVDWGEDGIRLLVDKAGASVATFDGRQDRSSANRPILMRDDGTIDLVEIETPTDRRTTHIKAVYWDEDDGYARRFTEELVDPDYVAGDPRVTVELYQPGVTRQSQALRDCRYRLNVDRLRPVAYEYGVGIGDLDLLPMDIVTLYADSPALAAREVIVVGTTYGEGYSGRVSVVKYDADVYDDTSDTLQKRAASLSRAKALKLANQIPAGVTNVTLTEVPGSSHLRADWDVQADANRRYLRIYMSDRSDTRGTLQAECDPTTQSYLIRNVAEGTVWVRILSVSRAGTEEDFITSGARARMAVTRQKTKPSAVTNGAVQIIGGPSKVVKFSAPKHDDPPQKMEVIKGPDQYRGQIVGTVDAERTGTTSDQGQGTQSVPLPTLPGRGTGGGDETIVIRAVNEGGKAAGAATSLSVPFLDMPNHSSLLLSSIIGATLTGYAAAASTDAWEYDATDGARLRAVPAQSAATSANGWGNGGAGLLADNPQGAKFITSGVIASDEIDIGSIQTFILECYDEAQRDAVSGSISMRHANFPAMPADVPTETDYDGGPYWAARLLDGSLRPLRPLASTFWEYRIGDTSPLSGDWDPVAIGAFVRGRHIETRFTLSDPLGHHQVISPRVYVRAHVPSGSATVVTKSVNYSVGAFDSLVLVDTAATITLPDAANHDGRTIKIKSSLDAVQVTVDSDAGNIDGESSQLLGGKEGIAVISDGTDWWII